MKLITELERKISDGCLVYSFGGNRNIIKAEIALNSTAADFSNKTIEVKYAQNGITSDLILFGLATVGDSEVIEITAAKPVSATHIYISCSQAVDSVKLYEEEDNTAECYYPSYFDTDLKENYYLDTVSVFVPSESCVHYSVYTSLDGRDFDFLVRKADSVPCNPSTGDCFAAEHREARIIRVYIEYNSKSVNARLERVEFSGELSGNPIKLRPEINICNFSESEYNTEICECDTYDEVYGIIERRLGKEYKSWFKLQLCENPKKNGLDFFELTFTDGKLCIKGNCGVSLAVGLNHYLKYYCKVNISQVGDQNKMPKAPVMLSGSVFRETKAAVRYSYNYCTLSYSMAFWGESDWRNELDWLALNGVNAVLDATAQEEVWRRFLTELGYSHEEILKFVAGPAYYAWAYMANLSGFGGPVHDSWFYERTELARKNHLIMRRLGMYPVLQGYSGMVPNDISLHDSAADIIPQGTWCSFMRPTMLRTTSPCFKEYAHKFYEAQKQVYGEYSKYFATDPFHEGGNIADMNAADISREVLSAMLRENNNAVWIIQSWQNNPTSELLRGLEAVEDGKHHALILDLYAEKSPNYLKGCKDNPNHGYSPEFDGTPWVYCMLNNFGGRLGLHGHLDNINRAIPKILNCCKYLAGIGITPEASMNNPVLYDFLFDSVWKTSASDKASELDINAWIHEYALRRYGAESGSAEKAWEILLDTVYKAELNNLGQGAPESVVNARPSTEIRAASTWGNAVISYDKRDLKTAAEYLLADYALLKQSKGYKYDLVTVLQQVLSNTAQNIYEKMISALDKKQVSEFKDCSKAFLKLADCMESVTSCSEYYMLGRWIAQAENLAANTDDFSKMLYIMNAKSLITTWGSYNQCETGGLHDYSNRQWSGLISDYYKPRWERWINARINELEGREFEKDINWFDFEWGWVRESKSYSTKPQELDLKLLGNEILKM